MTVKAWGAWLGVALAGLAVGYLLGVRGRGELSPEDRAALTVYRATDSLRAADWVAVQFQLEASRRRIAILDSLNQLLGRRVLARDDSIRKATRSADSLKVLRELETDPLKRLALCEQEVRERESQCAGLAQSKADLEVIVRNNANAAAERDTTIARQARKIADDSTYHVTKTLPLIARLEKAAEPCGSLDTSCIDGLGGWNFTSKAPVIGLSIPVARVKVLFLRLQIRGAAVWEPVP